MEDVPSKIMLIAPTNGDLNLVVLHSEAQVGLRKILIELAKKHFKELDKLVIGTVVGHITEKGRKLERDFIEHAKRTMLFDKTKKVPAFSFENTTGGELIE
jgi:hypothetical protein